MFNNPVILSGGENIDVKVLDEYGQYKYSLKALQYKKVDFCEEMTAPNGATTKPQAVIKGRDANNLLIFNKETLFRNDDGTYEGDIVFNFDFSKDVDYLVPMYVDVQTTTATIDIYDEGASTRFLIMGSASSETAYFSSSGGVSTTLPLQKTLTLKPPKNGATKMHIVIKGFGENDALSIGKIAKRNGYNTDEIDDTKTDAAHTYKLVLEGAKNPNENIEAIERIMNEILGDSATQYDWTYNVPGLNKVSQPTNASSYWNVNHIYNGHTIPKIDFDNTKIKVNPATLV